MSGGLGRVGERVGGPAGASRPAHEKRPESITRLTTWDEVRGPVVEAVPVEMISDQVAGSQSTAPPDLGPGHLISAPMARVHARANALKERDSIRGHLSVRRGAERMIAAIYELPARSLRVVLDLRSVRAGHRAKLGSLAATEARDVGSKPHPTSDALQRNPHGSLTVRVGNPVLVAVAGGRCATDVATASLRHERGTAVFQGISSHVLNGVYTL